jgi:hypothetical protein
VKKNYVTFYSPGTMVAETTRREIASWNVTKALKMMEDIKERHGATPYGFFFTTMKRGLRDFEPKETARSGMYYVNCRVQTLEEVMESHNPAESTLLQNMKTNGWDKIVTTKSGWAWSQQLLDEDTVL